MEAAVRANFVLGKNSSARKIELLETYIKGKDFIPGYRRLLKKQLQKAAKSLENGISQILKEQAKMIDEEVAQLQSRKGEEKLFQRDPEFGRQAQNMLTYLQKIEHQCNEEAQPARQMARELYGR